MYLIPLTSSNFAKTSHKKYSILVNLVKLYAFEHTGPGRMANLDKDLVRNAVINLVTNSIKYAGENAVIILKTDISGHRVVISIKDNGIGIAEYQQKDLFTPFFKVSNNGNIPWTGLGLSIVLKFVNILNGKLSFSSIPYQETCFKMSFLIT